MCNLEEPRSASGPVLCDKAKELILRCVLEGDRNTEIRAALRKAQHIHSLSDAALYRYRQMPLIREARVQALINVRDVGVVSLARRVERLNDAAEDLIKAFKQTRDYVEKATLARAFVLVCREISRLVDHVGRDDANGIPNAPTEDTPHEISVESVLRVMRTMSAQKRRLVAAQYSEPETTGNVAEHLLQPEKEPA